MSDLPQNVRNLIEAAQKAEIALARFNTLQGDAWDVWKELRHALAAFDEQEP